MNCCTGTYNLCVNQGATFTRIFTWLTGTCCGQNTVGAQPQPVNLTGYTAVLQIRNYPGATLLYDASPDLTLGGAAGTITLAIPAANTDTFTWLNGVYDLLMTDPLGNATRLLEGTVSVSLAVSV